MKLKAILLFIPFLLFLGCDDDLNDGDSGTNNSGSGTGGPSAKTALSTTATLKLSGKDISHFKIANDGENNSIGIASIGTDVYIFELEKGAKADSADIGANYSINDIALKDLFIQPSGGMVTEIYHIRNIEVNPYTKQVYMLANDKRLYTFTVNSAGTGSFVAVDLSDVRAVKIAAGTGLSSINDFAWDKAENQFYISYGSTGDLRGAIAWLKGPFASDTTSATYRQTLFTFSTPQEPPFYAPHTAAPIEKISVATIADKSFLSGENTCSPIFSEETANIRKSTTSGINFAQTFNMVTNTPSKIFHQVDASGNVYLMVIKGGTLSRIGQVFIDGTYNNDPDHSNGNTAQKPGGFSRPGTTPLTESEYKEVASSVTSAAAYSVGKVLILSNAGLHISNI